MIVIPEWRASRLPRGYFT